MPTLRAIGVDFGSKRIGIALSGGSIATPYEVVVRCGDVSRDHRRIVELAQEAEAECIVVGLPLSLDGSVGPAAQAVLDEVDLLEGVARCPVETYDERFTTVTAEQSLTEMDMRAPARRRVVDKVAATVMLQAWLDNRSTQERD